MGTLRQPVYATCENIAILAMRAIADIESVAKRQYVPKNVQIILDRYNQRLRALHAADNTLDA
jgi:hypothetical protein